MNESRKATRARWLTWSLSAAVEEIGGIEEGAETAGTAADAGEEEEGNASNGWISADDDDDDDDDGSGWPPAEVSLSPSGA